MISVERIVTIVQAKEFNLGMREILYLSAKDTINELVHEFEDRENRGQRFSGFTVRIQANDEEHK